MKTLNGQASIRPILFIFLIVSGALLYRRTDAFTHPQLWAEDGPLYFQQWEQFGLRSFIMPDGGYLHFVPRLIAMFWGVLYINYLYIPACYSISEYLFVLFIAINIWKTSAYLGIKHRVLYACSFLLLPIGSDIFMDLANINWIASLYLINFVFVRYTDYTRKNNLWNLVALAIISLSGPFSTLLLPVIALLIIRERKELSLHKLAPIVIILIGGVIQLIYLKIIDPGMYRGQPGPPEQYHMFKLVTNNMEMLLFFKHSFHNLVRPLSAIVISLLVFAVAIYIFVRAYFTIGNKRRYILLTYAAIVFASFIQAYWPNESKVIINNPRYYFLPFTCCVWLLIIAFDKKINLAYIAVVLLFFFFQDTYIPMQLPDMHWRKQILEYYDGKTNVIDINPEGWKIGLPERKK